MEAKSLIVFLLGLAFLGGDFARKDKACVAYVRLSGSAPPLHELYACVSSLNGKTYNAAAAEGCLNSILRSGYFRKGHIDVASGDSNVILYFSLDAPPVTVKSVTFDGDPSLTNQMLNWAKDKVQMLNPADAYDTARDDRTIEVLNVFFWDIGKRAGVTRDLNLDYRSGSASLLYRITIGPDMIPIRALPPFEKSCPVAITKFDRTDVDDYAPLDLLDKMTRTHAFTCFNEALVPKDTKTLENSALFAEARYEVEGGPQAKEIHLHVRGNHLNVKDVRTKGYGIFSGDSSSDVSGLALRPGDTYTRSAANASVGYLRGTLARQNEVVEVFEDDEITTEKQVVVTFQVLGYDEDTVTIDGKEFRVARGSITPQP
jgi:hypothetical protein